MAHPKDNDSSSDEDLVRAIDSSRKRTKTRLAQHTTPRDINSYGTTTWARLTSHTYNNSSQSQRHHRGISLPDIDLEDNRRDPRSATTHESEDTSQDSDNTFGSWPRSSRYGRLNPPDQRPRRNQKHGEKDQDALKEELRRVRASNEALLLVLEDRLSGLPPTNRNTAIHMYAEHFEVALSKLDHKKIFPNREGTSPQSATALLYSKLSSSHGNLEEQLKHVRKFLWPTLGDKSVLAYMSNIDRVMTRKYIVKRVTLDEQQDDLSRLGMTSRKDYELKSTPQMAYVFKEIGEANRHLERIIKDQQRLNHECSCRSVRVTTCTEEKYKKMRKRKGLTCCIQKYKRTCDDVPLDLLCYQLFHCSDYYTYWYIDVEVNWETGQKDEDDKAIREGKRKTKNDAEDNPRGTKLEKYKSTNVWVVSGSLLKAAEGHADTDTFAEPGSVMELTGLPTSVWKERHLANMHAAELFSCSSKVNKAIRNHNDDIAWQRWIKPAMHQAWSRLIGHKDGLFECTVDIPDMMRHRLSYDAISVQVEYIGS